MSVMGLPISELITMTTQEDTNVTSTGLSKSALIRAEFSNGNTKAADIRKALEEKGIQVSDNLISSVKKKLTRDNATEVAPGVVRVRREGTSKAPVARAGSKKEAILNLHDAGTTKASDIQAALKRQGMEASINTIYVTISKHKSANKTSLAKKPAMQAKPREAAPKPQLRKVTPKEPEPIHPELVKLMQAASLQYGAGAVEKAAQHVGQRSREMIKETFQVA